MRAQIRRFLSVVLTCMLVAGCAAPGASGSGGASQTEQSSQVALSATPMGTPWKDWFVRGVMTGSEEIRPQDDYFAATNASFIRRANDRLDDSWTPTAAREQEIADQMLSLITDTSKTSASYQDDLDDLRAFHELACDWEGRDADGTKPVKPLFDRLRGVKTLDEFTSWICSDDYRLSLDWHIQQVGSETSGLPLFQLSLFNPIDEKTQQVADGYSVEVMSPMPVLSTLLLEDADLESEENLEAFISASVQAEMADYMLRRMGLTEQESANAISDAATLESLAMENVSYGYENYKELKFGEVADLVKGGFPLDRVIQAYGYTDATTYIVDDTAWLEGLSKLYTKENLKLFVSHALVGLALSCSSMLDSEAADTYAEFTESSLASDDEGGAGVGDADTSDGTAYTDAQVQEYLDRQRRASEMLLVKETLPTCFAKLYVENFYDESINEQVKAMVRRIVEQYATMISTEDWLDAETRNAAIDKLRAIRVQVGYPDKWSDTSAIEVTSRKDGGTLFEESRKLNGIQLAEELKELRHPLRNPYWGDCMDVNAYYMATTNSITIGAGILGGAFWPKDATDEQALGGTGVTIGHEISHAFDDEGALFDKFGAYKNWWTDGDAKDFEQRVQRVRDAYAKIDPLGIGGYNGDQVCGEAIADLGGMKAVMGVAAQDSDFDYRAFFEAYAQSWADCSTMDVALESFEGDTHPLNRDRVNMVVRETDEFAETYGVKQGDDMYLAEKDRVSVW